MTRDHTQSQYSNIDGNIPGLLLMPSVCSDRYQRCKLSITFGSAKIRTLHLSHGEADETAVNSNVR